MPMLNDCCPLSQPKITRLFSYCDKIQVLELFSDQVGIPAPVYVLSVGAHVSLLMLPL